MPRQIKAASAFGEFTGGERCHDKSKSQPPSVRSREAKDATPIKTAAAFGEFTGGERCHDKSKLHPPSVSSPEAKDATTNQSCICLR